MCSDKLFMGLSRDIAHYLSEYLSIDDISNMYKAGRYLKLFVDRFYLKDGYIMTFNIICKNKLKKFGSFMDFLAIQKSEANFCFDKDGLSIFELDSAQNSMFQLNLKHNFFNNMWCPLKIKSGISLKNLARLINTNSNMHNMQLGIKINDLTRISIIYRDFEKRVIEYEIKTVELNNIALEIPETKFDLEIQMDIKLWSSIILKFEQMKINNVNINYHDNKLKFSGR